MSWRVWWQDYRNWRNWDLKQPHPKVEFMDLVNHQVALEHKEKLRSLGYTVCISPSPPPKRGHRGRKVNMYGEQRFNENWKLTR